jgi:hypothetical protein
VVESFANEFAYGNAWGLAELYWKVKTGILGGLVERWNSEIRETVQTTFNAAEGCRIVP